MSTNKTIRAADTMIDYYQVLQCDKTASNKELKRSYQRLVLVSHPDKLKGKQDSEDTFQLVHKAWLVLRDPKTRKEYDAALACHEHNELLLYDTIILSSMEFNCCESVFTYQCRCGGMYVLEPCEPMPPVVIIGCDECSFSIKVIVK